ncbi:MAG: serine/threonine protein kinase [Ardenticatenaceae bacterium]|nr:serine/threonine protein kinase [Anaerolineales bacterium]MCB8920083.1 serine/threonine protein kinase [Ardenticatenaceae bacterium]
MATSLEGQTLGKYRVLEPLGSGGMARVYRGYHPQLDRFVAIKVLRSDLVEDDTFLARFQREAQAIANLRHPNIIQVHDFDVQDDTYYMVMELLEGDTLHTRLTDYRVRDEQMPWGEMARTLLDVLHGLAYAHEAGMIHRDIKPANILLARQGQAVLADFGIAQIVGGTRHTMTGALLGTLNYMAPEQGLQGVSDVRSDLYSLGVVFYEMLTRQTPYDADTPLAILMKHVNDPLPLPRQLNPVIPPSFERIVLKALAKEPDERYQSAMEMAEALQQAAAEAEVSVPTRISLPLSFTTRDAPQESVAVYSGTQRAKLHDAGFAAQDTAATQSVDWEAQLAQLKESEKEKKEVGVSTAVPIPFLRHLFWNLFKRPLHDLELSIHSISTGRAVVNGIGLVVIGNMLTVMFSGISGPGDFFRVGWPIELYLTGGALLYMMVAMRNIWLFIPAVILIGNAFLMSYYTITGNWQHWAFLWPLELFVVFTAVAYPINIADNPQVERLAVHWGLRLGRAALIAMLILAIFALVQ